MNTIHLYKPLFLAFFVFLFLASCSPEDGVDGSDGVDGTNSLIKTMIEGSGDNCPNGGFLVEVGLDTNRNNQLDPIEVTSSEYLCTSVSFYDPFDSYVALISQSGTSDPISWSRLSTGIYIGQSDTAIDINKTVIFYTTPATHTGVRGELIGNDQIRLELQNGINTFQDNFDNLSFELRQYQ